MSSTKGITVMRKSPRLTLALAVSALLFAGSAMTATAAVPINDVPGGAVATTLGNTYTLAAADVTDATTDAIDAAMNAQCGAPATEHSVWYTFTGTDDSGFLVDGSASTGFAELGFMIIEGDPTSTGTVLACSPWMTGIHATAGTTYYIMAFSAVPGGSVGELSFTVSPMPPLPTVSLTVNPRGTVYKDGTAKIGGTYLCSGGEEFGGISGSLMQRVGRMKINGYFEAYPLCDGTTQTWDAIVFSDNGLFAGGKSANISVGFACNVMYDCTEAYTEQTIKLSRAAKK